MLRSPRERRRSSRRSFDGAPPTPERSVRDREVVLLVGFSFGKDFAEVQKLDGSEETGFVSTASAVEWSPAPASSAPLVQHSPRQGELTERIENQKHGYGAFSDAEVEEDERQENERGGNGFYTAKEVLECRRNEAAGRKYMSDLEYEETQLEKPMSLGGVVAPTFIRSPTGLELQKGGGRRRRRQISEGGGDGIVTPEGWEVAEHRVAEPVMLRRTNVPNGGYREEPARRLVAQRNRGGGIVGHVTQALAQSGFYSSEDEADPSSAAARRRKRPQSRRERTSEKLDPYDSIVAEREGTRLSTVSILIRVTFGLGLLVWLVTWYWCYLRPTSAVCPVLEDVEAAVRKSVNGLF